MTKVSWQPVSDAPGRGETDDTIHEMQQLLKHMKGKRRELDQKQGDREKKIWMKLQVIEF
jgi:hypothetical protein